MSISLLARSRARAMILLVLSLWSSGCFAYQNVGRLPEEGSLPSDVRVYRYNGPIVDLARARIAADTIRGFSVGSETPVVIPMAHVDSLHFKAIRKGPSLLLAGVAVGGIALLTAWMASPRPGQGTP